MGVLKSKGFARRFIEQNDLVEVIANEMTRTPRGGNSEQPDVREIAGETLALLGADVLRALCLDGGLHLSPNVLETLLGAYQPSSPDEIHPTGRQSLVIQPGSRV